MDSMIAAAGRALAAGDVLGALKRVALREDPSALALRGIAMARLGEYPRARELLKRAARGFGTREPLAHARCIVAEGEVSLAMRELGTSPRALAQAATALEARADRANASLAHLVMARRLLLLGRLQEAASPLSRIDTTGLPPSLAAATDLARAEIGLRSLHTAAAAAALDRAAEAAGRARIPALQAEVTELRTLLERPAARAIRAGQEQPLRLDEVEALLTSGALIVDACRRGLRTEAQWRPLARRPVLFGLLCTLAEDWPGEVERKALIARVFRTHHPDETHRARLRVEIGRLRALIAPEADIEATVRGFALVPRGGRSPIVLAPPIAGERAALFALLADGAAWSTSALALALGSSQRTVQRALVELEAEGRVRSIGRARAQRWLSPPLAGFTTILLLPALAPAG